MKKVKLEKKPGIAERIIETPWLRADEAAVYCGISKSKFGEVCSQVPHGLRGGRTKVWHVEKLDNWIKEHGEGDHV